MANTIEILDRLISFDTVSANSNLDIIDFIESYLKERGFKISRLADPEEPKAGLVAEIGSGDRGIVLSAHTDVVPVDGQDWQKTPFKLTREDDRLYGRGTTDMKGYVASVLSLADRAAKAELKEPLKIVLSYDEEIGCVGIHKMKERVGELIGNPRACFVGEPTEMQVAIGHKGKAALRAICHGENGHSALAPNYLNALHLAGDFLAELRGIQEHYTLTGARDPAYDIPYSTVHVGKLNGGRALNIVPDRAELTFEYRHLAGDDPADILAKINGAAERVESSYRKEFPKARIEVEQYNSYPGLEIDHAHPVVAQARRLADDAEVTKVAFGTEAGFFDALGIPTIVCGPGSMEGQGHKPDEYISIEQLQRCDTMMDRILEELSVGSV